MALAFALAVSAATVGAFVLIYLVVANDNAVRIGAILSEEVRRNLDAPQERLQFALEARQTPDIRRVDYIALFDPRGVRVFGNLTRMPDVAADGKPHVLGAHEMRDLGAMKESAVLVAARRADGGEIVLGRALQEAHDVEKSLRRALKLALAPTILAILAIGLLFARRTMERLDRMRGAMNRIMEGRLDLRLPVTGERDEIDQVARAVNLMLNEIARLLDQLRQVGDNIAHDLRSPLAVTRAKIERALRSEPAAAREQMEVALAQLDRANAAIAALLRISAVDRGARRERFGDVDLAELCAQTAEFFEPLASSRSVSLTVDAPGPLIVRGDEDLLREAIANLVENAIKFTPAGGSVQVVAARTPEGPRVEVADTGPGVQPAERDKIFRRFYSAPSQGGGAGHGLGLSIVRTIAELHGFEIGVEDNAPGARFVMRATRRPASVLKTQVSNERIF